MLAIALLGIAVAAPMIRLSHDPPLSIAVWRLGFSLLVILPFLAQSSRVAPMATLLATMSWSPSRPACSSRSHFWSWNASIFYTSVAASVVLVNTQPIIVALLSAIWLEEMPTQPQWFGITLAVAGACIVGWGDFSRTTGAAAGSHALLGDGLALLGGIAVAIYDVAAGAARPRSISGLRRTGVQCLFLTLVAIALATATPLWHTATP